MKMHSLTRIMLFALFGMIVGGAIVQSAPELPENIVRFAPVLCAVAFQGLHFVSVPLGVLSFTVPTTLKGVIEQRGELAKKMRDLITLLETEKREFTVAEKKSYDEWDKEFDQVQSHLEILDKAEKRNLILAASMPAPAPGVNNGLSKVEEKDFSKFSIVRGLQLMANGKNLDGVEAEVHSMAEAEAREAGIKISGFAVPSFLGTRPEKRASQTVTGTTSVLGDQGGFSVQTEVNTLIEGLWANNFMSLVGATRFAGLVGNQTFPVQSTNPLAEAVTENGTLTDQIINFGHVDMAPKRRGATIPMTKQLLMQSSFDVQGFIITQIQKALDKYLNVDANTVLQAAITGGNLIALGTNGAAPAYTDIVMLETILAAADADKGNIKYLTNPKVRGKLKGTSKLGNTIAEAVWEKDNTMNGYGAITSTIIPSNLTKGSSSGVCSSIIIGNFADLYVGMWGGVDFVVDPYTLAKTASVQITANMFWDVEVARAASFAGIKDALTT